MSRINYALQLALHYHAGQKDKSGCPYLFHIMGVMENVRALYGHEDEELLQIAALHDIIEDTSATVDTLKHIFSPRVVTAVVALTKVKGQSYKDYQEVVLANRDASRVKIADIMHNMREDRNDLTCEKTLTRLNKYSMFLYRLKESYGVT